ncbi:MAG: DNA polymerase III subunit delta' [Desulfovibrio sp.]|nr:DNA polymerase III subunit delta' [Desulfovibrio sp.]
MDAAALFKKPPAGLEAVRRLLGRLGEAPPQVLLLEGGNEEERLYAALYWACRVNCQAAGPRPCLACQTCRQIKDGTSLDLLRYDGRLKNKDDNAEEEPGQARPFSIENARALKSLLLEAPRGPGYRVVVLEGIVQQREDAANALLKALEDPSPFTLFILLAPQREQLLPTLASRSFCVTLPWPDSRSAPAVPARQAKRMAAWDDTLAGFLETGKGLTAAMSAKNAVDVETAQRLILRCQKACVHALSEGAGLAAEAAKQGLEGRFSLLDTKDKLLACRWFVQAQEAIRYNVSPARVLRTLLTQVFLLMKGRAPSPIH